MKLICSENKYRKAASVAAGVAVGAANGLFGGGGGMIAVPALALAGARGKKAHATAVAVIAPLSVISGAVYLANGAVPMSVALPACIGIFLGGIAGALLLKKANSVWLTRLFYVLMIAAGIKSAL